MGVFKKLSIVFPSERAKAGTPFVVKRPPPPAVARAAVVDREAWAQDIYFGWSEPTREVEQEAFDSVDEVQRRLGNRVLKTTAINKIVNVFWIIKRAVSAGSQPAEVGGAYPAADVPDLQLPPLDGIYLRPMHVVLYRFSWRPNGPTLIDFEVAALALVKDTGHLTGGTPKRFTLVLASVEGKGIAGCEVVSDKVVHRIWELRKRLIKEAAGFAPMTLKPRKRKKKRLDDFFATKDAG